MILLIYTFLSKKWQYIHVPLTSLICCDFFQPKECVGYPGFVTKFRVADKSGANEKPDDHVDYENYRHVCHKWHYKIAKALVVCLESKDYVQIRNALTVLTKILPHFPVIVNLSVVIEKE